jgi:hypothetical protein
MQKKSAVSRMKGWNLRYFKMDVNIQISSQERLMSQA